MSKVGYRGSNGALTTNEFGFAFVRRERLSDIPSTRGGPAYGNYCAALGGWYSASPSVSSSDTLYKASGDYYSQGGWSANGTYGVNYTNGTAVGSISSITLYTIATQTGLTGGNVYVGSTGTDTTKDVESGKKYVLRAVPSTGYLVSSIDGTAVSDVSTGAKTAEFTASSDVSGASAVFTPYYSISFNANGGIRPPSNISPCLAGETYTLPTGQPTRSGYKFLGWATSAADAASGVVSYIPGAEYSRVSASANQTVTLYAVWKQYTLTYDSNGGTPTPSSQTAYGSVTIASAVALAGRDFLGWKIDDTIYQPGATYDLVQSDVTAVAQWTTISILNNDTDKGSISLFDVTADEMVAHEASGYIKYSGEANHLYRVVATPASFLYAAKGAYVDGSYVEPYSFTFDGADVEVVYHFAAKPLYFVADATPANAGGTLAVTSPAEPDGTVSVGGATMDAYAEGRNIVVTVSPDEEKIFTSANIYDENDVLVGSVSGDNIGNNSFTLRNNAANRYVKGVFAAKTYAVSLSKDSASSAAISSVSVTSGGSSVSEVAKNVEVTFSVTVASGYGFDGFYEKGEKIADMVETSGSTFSVTRQIAAATALVAKAKVSVTLGLSADGEAVLSVNGEPYVAGTPFYVTLGDSVTYELTVTAADKYFNGWFNATDSSYETPLPNYGTTKTFSPTASLNIVALIGDIDTTKPVVATFAYADGSDATRGVFAVGGVSGPQTVTLEYSESVAPTVVLTAMPKNGYAFAGWFTHPSAQGDAVTELPSATVSVNYSKTFYALFVQDPHSVCEWEGTRTPKAMTWRSKTYEASKPFNPSACRVDALGYVGDGKGTLLEFTVDMFSAPNTAATSTAKLVNIANQNARRLPVMRPERYMQVEVKANAEVDALLVGTSMGGLAQ